MSEKKSTMKMSDRLIAITDLETTGLDAQVHEIIDIGLLMVDQKTLLVVDTLDVKVRPEHIETASEYALKLNGYNEADWRDAVSLETAMKLYSTKTKNAIFCSHNTTFDWPFTAEGFKKTDVANLMDYHRLDTFTMAWTKLHHLGLEKFNSDALLEFFHLEKEPPVHSAINGAFKAYDIFKRLIAY